MRSWRSALKTQSRHYSQAPDFCDQKGWIGSAENDGTSPHADEEAALRDGDELNPKRRRAGR
jgi:hypothetical protein